MLVCLSAVFSAGARFLLVLFSGAPQEDATVYYQARPSYTLQARNTRVGKCSLRESTYILTPVRFFAPNPVSSMTNLGRGYYRFSPLKGGAATSGRISYTRFTDCFVGQCRPSKKQLQRRVLESEARQDPLDPPTGRCRISASLCSAVTT